MWRCVTSYEGSARGVGGFPRRRLRARSVSVPSATSPPPQKAARATPDHARRISAASASFPHCRRRRVRRVLAAKAAEDKSALSAHSPLRLARASCLSREERLTMLMMSSLSSLPPKWRGMVVQGKQRVEGCKWAPPLIRSPDSLGELPLPHCKMRRMSSRCGRCRQRAVEGGRRHGGVGGKAWSVEQARASTPTPPNFAKTAITA